MAGVVTSPEAAPAKFWMVVIGDFPTCLQHHQWFLPAGSAGFRIGFRSGLLLLTA